MWTMPVPSVVVTKSAAYIFQPFSLFLRTRLLNNSRREAYKICQRGQSLSFLDNFIFFFFESGIKSFFGENVKNSYFKSIPAGNYTFDFRLLLSHIQCLSQLQAQRCPAKSTVSLSKRENKCFLVPRPRLYFCLLHFAFELHINRNILDIPVPLRHFKIRQRRLAVRTDLHRLEAFIDEAFFVQLFERPPDALGVARVHGFVIVHPCRPSDRGVGLSSSNRSHIGARHRARRN